MPRTAHVHRIPQSSPDDVSGLDEAVQSERIHVPSIVAILGKTEGNGCVNDFTRAFAVQSLQMWLKRHHHPNSAGDKSDDNNNTDVCLVMSGGTEGGISPHLIVLEVRDGVVVDDDATKSSSESGSNKRQKLNPTRFPGGSSLSIGVAHSEDLPSHHLGRIEQVKMVVDTIRLAMSRASTSTDQVHFVQIKCPLLTASRIRESARLGHATATNDTLKSMKLSRGASALAVAVATGEVSLDSITDDTICQDWSKYSTRASTSGGVELLNHEVVVLGMSPEWEGPLAIDHAVMRDGIDVNPIREALVRLGLFQSTADHQQQQQRYQLSCEERDRVVCLLAKAEASSTGQIRGKRHVMLDDSDISATRHARGFVAGAIAGLIGHTELFVSGGAEHQGPDGGGPVAVIVDRN